MGQASYLRLQSHSLTTTTFALVRCHPLCVMNKAQSLWLRNRKSNSSPWAAAVELARLNGSLNSTRADAFPTPSQARLNFRRPNLALTRLEQHDPTRHSRRPCICPCRPTTATVPIESKCIQVSRAADQQLYVVVVVGCAAIIARRVQRNRLMGLGSLLCSALLCCAVL